MTFRAHLTCVFIWLVLASPVPCFAQLASAPEGVRWSLEELGFSPEERARATRGREDLSFRLRRDQVFTAAALRVSYRPETSSSNAESLAIVLNGELVAQITPEAAQPRAANVALDPALLSDRNTLSLYLVPTGASFAPEAPDTSCRAVAAGSWQGLDLQLAVSSIPLPLPADLASLPLPFVDTEFEREQRISLVLGGPPTSDRIRVAAMVASWFALQAKGRLRFESHESELPPTDAVVLLDTPVSAAKLGLPTDTLRPGEASLALLDHPRAPGRKLLVLAGDGPAQLERVGRGLLRDGYASSGARRAFPNPVTLPVHERAPRWVSEVRDIRLGQLPEVAPLRVSGGRDQTVRIDFRVAPDLFAWSSETFTIDLRYAQRAKSPSNFATLHVVFNGSYLTALPRQAAGRSLIAVPREALRGYNELLIHADYGARQGGALACESPRDPSAQVSISADSRISLGSPPHFATLPNLALFVHDGFPFTARPDQSATLAVLPEHPAPEEVTMLLAWMAHFATITGVAPTELAVALGSPEAQLAKGRDILLISAQGRHPFLRDWATELPLDVSFARAEVQRPTGIARWLRYLRGELQAAPFDDAEAQLSSGSFAAVMGRSTLGASSGEAVVVTASAPENLPSVQELQRDARSKPGTQADLLLLTEPGYAAYELGVKHAHGTLPPWIALRFWLAQYWLLLVPCLLLGAFCWALAARLQLAALSQRRLNQERA